jgi:glutathione S-transferase
MKLHHHLASPFARMCVVTAHETGILDELTLMPVGEFSPVVEHERLASDNPLGRVPALVTDHGHPLYDSRVICEYLCHHAGNKALLPDEPVKRFRVMTLQALGQGMCDTAVALRYEMANRPDARRWPDYIDRQKRRLVRAADSLERTWMDDLGQVTVGTIAVGAALGYIDFRHPDFDWRQGHARLARWFGEFSKRPSMAETAPRQA